MGKLQVKSYSDLTLIKKLCEGVKSGLPDTPEFREVIEEILKRMALNEWREDMLKLKISNVKWRCYSCRKSIKWWQRSLIVSAPTKIVDSKLAYHRRCYEQ